MTRPSFGHLTSSAVVDADEKNARHEAQHDSYESQDAGEQQLPSLLLRSSDSSIT